MTERKTSNDCHRNRSMNFSENELPRKDRTSSFLTYDEAGKRVLKFQANFSEVFEVLSSNDGSNFIQIRLVVSNLPLT